VRVGILGVDEAEPVKEEHMLSSDRDYPRRALLTVPEVALMLGCGRTLVYDLIGSRQLPVVKVGRLTRVPVAGVDDFVSRHLTTTITPTLPTRSHPRRVDSRPSRSVMEGGLGQVQLFDNAPGG
jgi:excisionase family DNA binding protein